MEEKQTARTFSTFREVAIIDPVETVAKEGWVKWGKIGRASCRERVCLYV